MAVPPVTGFPPDVLLGGAPLELQPATRTATATAAIPASRRFRWKRRADRRIQEVMMVCMVTS